MCEIPLAVAACPTGAIKATTVDGKKSVMVNNEKCMYCGNCFTMCPSMPLADAEGSGVWQSCGGKTFEPDQRPDVFQSCGSLPSQEPPRRSQTVEAIKKILYTYADNAKKYERLGDWARGSAGSGSLKRQGCRLQINLMTITVLLTQPGVPAPSLNLRKRGVRWVPKRTRS
jgi:dissimilatory sulfite reductase (desulfoviridin) alpha/beta subunit